MHYTCLIGLILLLLDSHTLHAGLYIKHDALLVICGTGQDHPAVSCKWPKRVHDLLAMVLN